jgi:hypothetical protein
LWVCYYLVTQGYGFQRSWKRRILLCTLPISPHIKPPKEFHPRPQRSSVLLSWQSSILLDRQYQKDHRFYPNHVDNLLMGVFHSFVLEICIITILSAWIIFVNIYTLLLLDTNKSGPGRMTPLSHLFEMMTESQAFSVSLDGQVLIWFDAIICFWS